jgi:hypothetical protein
MNYTLKNFSRLINISIKVNRETVSSVEPNEYILTISANKFKNEDFIVNGESVDSHSVTFYRMRKHELAALLFKELG